MCNQVLSPSESRVRVRDGGEEREVIVVSGERERKGKKDKGCERVIDE